MGVTLTAEQLAAVNERSGFAWMKAHESQFRPPKIGKTSLGKMMRSGKSDQSSELLTAAQQTAIDAAYRNRLTQLESTFPYDQFFA